MVKKIINLVSHQKIELAYSLSRGNMEGRKRKRERLHRRWGVSVDMEEIQYVPEKRGQINQGGEEEKHSTKNTSKSKKVKESSAKEINQSRREAYVLVVIEKNEMKCVYKIPVNQFSNVDCFSLKELFSLGYHDVEKNFPHSHLDIRMKEPYDEFRYERWFEDLYDRKPKEDELYDWDKYLTTFEKLTEDFVGEDCLMVEGRQHPDIVIEEFYYIDTRKRGAN